MKNRFLHLTGLASVALLLTVQGAFAQAKADATPNLKVICGVNVHDPARPQAPPLCDKVVNDSAGYTYEVPTKVSPWKFDVVRGMGTWNADGTTPLAFNIIVPAGDTGKLRLLFWLPHGVTEKAPQTEEITVQGKKFGEVTGARGPDGLGEWVEGTYSAEDSKDGKLAVVITKADGLTRAFISGFEVISAK